ncbi:hypothetical protein Tco_0112457, partial [Tanacetum coccineum]
YDDELFDLETINDDTYDDLFYSKEEKIKDSKILLDELDLPGSSDFLPFLECDSIFYKDFSEVDALSSTNNEDEYLIGALKLSKLLKFLKARWRFFLALIGRKSESWMFCVSTSSPLDQLKMSWIFEASRARGFVLRSQELQVLGFIWESDIQILSTNVYL